MKKIIAMALVLMMVLSLATVAHIILKEVDEG